MRRFFITLSYNGKNYVGWQMQPNGVSVQQVLQDALSTILREQIEVVGAGRNRYQRSCSENGGTF